MLVIIVYNILFLLLCISVEEIIFENSITQRLRFQSVLRLNAFKRHNIFAIIIVHGTV